jgi:endoglycosylceramidase
VEHTLCRAVYEGQTDEAIALARSWGAPVLLGEFGASASPLNTTRLTQLADERLLSWMYWDDNYFRQAPDVVRSDLVRPYPQATAGTPLRQRYDPATGEFELRVRPDHAVAAPTAVVVPPDAYPDGYDVEVVGGTVVSEPQAGRLEVAADPTAQLLRVRLTRR